LVHVSDSDLTNWPELKKNPCGVENTIVLLEHREKTTLDLLLLLYQISAFDGCYFHQMNLFVDLCEKKEFKRGESIIKQDSVGEYIYIIIKGIVRIFKNEE
jgi:CRP-like cAMP-binding protein